LPVVNLNIPWPRRVAVRLTLAIAVVVATIFGTLLAAALREQRHHLEEEAVRGAALLSDTVKRSAHRLMLEDRRDEVYVMMGAVGQEPGIETVRIFNKFGQITYSNRPGEVGTYVDKQAESCYACHAAGEPLVRLNLPSRSRVFPGRQGQRVLAMVTPIYSEPSCVEAACHAHPAEKKVLGVLDVGLSLAEADRAFADLRRRSLWAAALGLGLLVAGTAFFTTRVVVRPVADLLEGTRRLAHGDLEHRLTVRRADEIGGLAGSFNAMTGSLARAQSELEQLNASLERQVAQRTAALEDAHRQVMQAEKLASLGRLSASIAHEINNPLTGILATAKLALRTLADEKDGDGDRGALRKSLGLVQRETERCTAIVRNLLDFARERPLSPRAVDLNQAVEEALSLVAHQLALKGVEVEKDLRVLPLIPADFGQLRQCFVNVAINAADAMPGGGRLRVRTRDRPDMESVEAEFEDTGVGIAPADLGRVFDPFFSTKEKGTGLGLSVVYGIVRRHGGDARAKSEPGRGTCITLRLPVKEGGHA
jgi:two-component system NtrC family sensor kinase